MKKLILVLVWVGIFASVAAAEVSRHDGDSFEHYLSQYFSEVTCPSDDCISIKMKCNSLRWVLRDRTRGSALRYLADGEVLRLPADADHEFFVPGLQRGLFLSATNMLPRTDGKMASTTTGRRLAITFEDVSADACTGSSCRGLSRRHFLLDMASMTYYDIDRGHEGKLRLPFHASDCGSSCVTVSSLLRQTHGMLAVRLREKAARRYAIALRLAKRLAETKDVKNGLACVVTAWNFEIVEMSGRRREAFLLDILRNGEVVRLCGMALHETSGIETIAEYDEMGCPVLVGQRNVERDIDGWTFFKFDDKGLSSPCEEADAITRMSRLADGLGKIYESKPH